MASIAREIIVITAASGKQCRFLVPILLENPRFKLRLIVNSPGSLSKLQETHANNENVEVVQANLADLTSCTSILKDATTVYHVNPNLPTEQQIGTNMVSAAVAEKAKPESKFQHFVFSSVYCSHFSKMLNHARKAKVEEYLAESAAPTTGNINWTIIQPGHLAEALIARLLAATKDNPGEDNRTVPFQNQFDPSVPFAVLSLKDLAEVSAKVIEEREKHYFATYGLSSTMPMPYQDFIHQIGDKLKVKFDIATLPFDMAVDANCVSAFGRSDVDQSKRDGPERLVVFYNKRGLLGNPNIVSWILGRPATDISGMVENAL